MTSEVERLATLEAQSIESTKHRASIVEKLERQDQDLLAIRNDVHAIKETLSGYKGFFAGFAFALAALGGLVGAAVTAAWHRFIGS